MATVSESKRKYSQLDHTDWVRWWNDINQQEGRPDKNIDFYWADIFPIRTPTVLRAVLVEPKLIDVLCKLTTISRPKIANVSRSPSMLGAKQGHVQGRHPPRCHSRSRLRRR